MSIGIENPTAEFMYRALQEVPPAELSRRGLMLLEEACEETSEEEEAQWRRISAHGVALYDDSACCVG